MNIKFIEPIRHGMTEPLLTVMVYKKVEGGKIVACYRLMYYSNKLISIFETDKLEGGIVDVILDNSMENLSKLIEKYYEDQDDIIIRGEEKYIEMLMESLNLE